MGETSKGGSEENPSAQSSGSIIQISSIYIELPLAPTEMHGDGCDNHGFSIRGYAFSKRNSINPNMSSLFSSNVDSNDEGLPPMEIPSSRYWRCSECRSRQMLNIEINEGIQPIGTSAGMQQVLRHETADGFQSDSTNFGIQQGHSAETCEEIRSIAKGAGMQQGPIARTIDGIQSISTSAGILKGPVAQTTEGTRSIETNGNANAVECSILHPATLSIATAKAVETAYTGDKNEPTEPAKDAVDKISDEGRNAKTGGVITDGDTEVATEKVISANVGDFSAQSVQQQCIEHTVTDIPGKIDETKSGRCRENDNSNGQPKRKFRKVRLLTDLLNEENSRVNTNVGSASLESAGSGYVASEGQVGAGKDVANGVQSPRRKTKANREDEAANDPSYEASNIKGTKKDTGKAIMATNVHTSDAEVTPSGGEGLFIGTKSERQRRRSDSTAPVSRKKNKQAEVLDFSSPIPSLVRSLSVPSPDGIWGGHPSLEQTDRNQAGLVSGPFKCSTSYSRPAKVGLDLSLGSFSKGSDSQDNGSETFLKKNDVLFGGSNVRPPSELCRSDSKEQSWDLNERATLMSYNLEKNESPLQGGMGFLQLGTKEKSSDQANQKERDQKVDDIPMDIVELLAEKQYERRHSNSSNDPIVQRTGDTTRSFFDREVIGTMKHMISGYPGLTNFPTVDTQRGTTVSSENARTKTGAPLTLSQLSRNHLNLVRKEDNLKSMFTNQNQDNPKSMFTSQKEDNLKNVFTNQNEDKLKSMFNNLLQIQQKPSSGISISPAASGRGGVHFIEGEPLLSSTSSKLGFGFGIQQNQSAQQHKGKTISDIKADELKKTEEAWFSFTKPGGSASGTKENVPLDNDSIPALQLLSLMDGRTSTSGLCSGTSKILDKPFLPCAFHSEVSRDKGPDFINGSLVFQDFQTKGSGSLRPSLSNSYPSLRPHSAALSSHISFITPERQMPRSNSLMPGSSSGAGPTSSASERGNQHRVLNGNSMAAFPLRTQKGTHSIQANVEPVNLPSAAKPGRASSADGVCRTNRNPADFSLPEAGNMYTLSGRELNPRKRKPYTKRNTNGGQTAGKKKRGN